MPGKTLQTQLEEEMHEAMKRRDEVLLSTLRMLRSAISNRTIEKRGKMAKAGDGGRAELSDDEVLNVIRSEAKKRRDAAAEFTKAGRMDLADKEGAELKILERYLPAELNDEEIQRMVAETVAETGAASEKDFGRVMGSVMKKAAGRASGNRIQDVVRKALS